ncbi:putative uncharacterized protein PQLC2L [Suricata suricatta]|uniref:putative uncharacterized protein PQLC2L n=1 Tax=Suricata suricatta TaxID=37032 RepID=UPI001155F2A8|nr:putative uncharacterized protein PQLC2L [Suricata suricatta]
MVKEKAERRAISAWPTENGKVDETLSLGFQICWIGGDLAKFIGCYLTNQLPIEIFTAPDFHMNMDISVLPQFMYYKLKNQKKNVRHEMHLDQH